MTEKNEAVRFVAAVACVTCADPSGAMHSDLRRPDRQRDGRWRLLEWGRVRARIHVL
jgi:hypothetical protein